MDSNLYQKINNLYEENPLLQDFNGYILIKEDDHILFQQNFGYSDYVQKKIADENTIYCLGSITKQFTALCVLQLSSLSLLYLIMQWDGIFMIIKYFMAAIHLVLAQG